MNFYRRRPFALAISLCLAVSAAVLLLPGVFKIILALVIPIVAFVIIRLLKHFGVTGICNLDSVPFVLVTSALSMCLLLTSFAYYDIYAAGYDDLTDGSITAVVTDVRSQKTYGAVYAVRLESLDGKKLRGKGLLRSENAAALSAGDVINAVVSFVPAGEFYESYEVTRQELLSDGYVFSCHAEDTVSVIGHKTTPEVFFTRLRGELGAMMSLYTDRDANALANALFLGDRSGLGRIYRDFSVSGIIHILSLSGMHLAILTGGIERLLRLCGIRGRMKSIPIFIFIAFYVSLTGFLMSVVRAALMVLLMYLAEAVDSRADTLTSLFVSVGIIVLVNPPAITDISLQLSFCATLGVILFTEAFEQRASERASGKRNVFADEIVLPFLGSIAAAVGATVFVLPLQWLYFGELSLVGIPATLLMSVVCEVLLLLYPMLLVLGIMGLNSVCYLLGGAVDMLSDIAAVGAEFTAGLASCVSLGYSFALPLLICLVSAVVFMAVKNVRSWISALVPVCLFFILYLGGVQLYDNAHNDDAFVDYVNYKTHDALVLTSERKTMIVDISNGSGVLLERARSCGDSRYITEVDTLLLTDASSKHINSLGTFLKYNVVRNVLIPVSDGEKRLYAHKLAEIAEEYGAAAVLYSAEGSREVRFGDLVLSFAEREYLSRSAKPLEAIKISCGDRDAVYLNRSSWESGTLWHLTDSAEYIFFGGNGPNYRKSPELSLPDSAEIISVPDDVYLAMLGDALVGYDGTITVGEYASAELSPVIK